MYHTFPPGFMPIILSYTTNSTYLWKQAQILICRPVSIKIHVFFVVIHRGVQCQRVIIIWLVKLCVCVSTVLSHSPCRFSLSLRQTGFMVFFLDTISGMYSTMTGYKESCYSLLSRKLMLAFIFVPTD